MVALDLFGGETAVTSPAPIGVAVDLFTATAERAAYASGRALSQERAELMAPNPAGDAFASWAPAEGR